MDTLDYKLNCFISLKAVGATITCVGRNLDQGPRTSAMFSTVGELMVILIYSIFNEGQFRWRGGPVTYIWTSYHEYITNLCMSARPPVCPFVHPSVCLSPDKTNFNAKSYRSLFKIYTYLNEAGCGEKRLLNLKCDVHCSLHIPA